jgi:tetratricopeptide (TPR) repeat protein
MAGKKPAKKQGKTRPDIRIKQKSAPAITKPGPWAIILPLLVVILTLILYWQAGKGQFLNWDDREYIVNNTSIRDLSGNGITNIFSHYQVANYHPLTTLTWAIEYKLYGLDPAPYHWFSVFLHLMNTLLVYLLAFRLMKKAWPATLVALLFGIHPMHVESVAWVSERKDLLYTLFFLASLLSYVKYLTDRKKLKWYVVALVTFLFSLLSKSAAVILPLILFLFDYYHHRKFDKKAVLEKIPFLLLSLLFGIIAIVAQRSVSAVNPLADYNIFDRILFVGWAVVYYLISAVVPFELSAVHFYPVKTGNLLPWFYYVAPILILAIGFLIYKARSFRRELVFGFLFFLIGLILVLQIMPLGRSMLSERYTYLPYIGLFMILALFRERLAGSKIKRQMIISGLTAAVFIVLCIAFSAMTWTRINVWKTSESLFRDVMEKYPDNYFGYYFTAFSLYEEGRYTEALPLFDRSISFYPKDFAALNNRGVIKVNTGDQKGALEDFSKAIEYNPGYAEAYNNRGSLNADLQKFPESFADYSRAISIRPAYVEAYVNRGLVYLMTKEYEKSIPDFDKAIELDPKMATAYYNRGASKINLGRTEEGCKDMQQALSLGFQKAREAMDKYCNAVNNE